MFIYIIHLLEAEPYEAFKNLSDGIHNIFIIAGIIVGAVWTLYTFSSLGARQKAKAELFKQAVLDISVECKQEHDESTNEDYILTNVKIVNKGNRNTLLDFTEPPLNIYKVNFRDDGSSYIISSFKQKNLLSSSIVLRSGATSEYPFIVKIFEKGFYLASFRVLLNDTEFEVHKDAGGPPGSPSSGIFWAGSTSIIIK